MDVIRCDEEEYLVWKWRPAGQANSTNKENSIRWGSSLRVKDGEVAVFVYKRPEGLLQEFIEGPFDETIKTSNFPILTNIIGLAYAGKSPFQAEIYFINLAGNQKMKFGVPFFNVFDSRNLNFPVQMSARGSIIYNLTDYRKFIKLHRLIDFDNEKLKQLVREAVIKSVKSAITAAPVDNGITVLQIENKIEEINDIVKPKIAKAFEEDFGVNVVRMDLEAIEVNKDEQYHKLMSITADMDAERIFAQNSLYIQSLQNTQDINTENLSETLRIQREETQRFQRLQTESQHLSAHQINRQADVLTAAAENLGEMGAMNLGGGGGSGGFNPVGVMTGMAIGGAMGGQMANMMNTSGQNIQQQINTPPPPPQIQYNLSINGQSAGPFNMAQLQDMVRNGQLTTGMHAWKPGMANWELAGSIPELASLFATYTPPPPPPAF